MESSCGSGTLDGGSLAGNESAIVLRAENATYKGTGLGLAIVRGIVDGHRGRVWIESEPGRGAAFLFSIPLA